MKEPNILIYFFFPTITQWRSISDILFTGGKGVSDFSVLKYYSLSINYYLVNILSECLRILIDNFITCWSVLPSEIVMYDVYIGGRGGRTEQLDIIARFLPCHWLYK